MSDLVVFGRILVAMNGVARFALRRHEDLPWWSAFGVVGLIWADVLLKAALRGYEPPNGWPAAAIATPVVLLVFLLLAWLGNLLARQYIAVLEEGLLIVAPFRRLVRFDDVEYVRCLGLTKPVGQSAWGSFFSRKLIPAWDEPPNIEVGFRRPLRLNLYPFNWFKRVQLTLDRPTECLARVDTKVPVDAAEASQMFVRTRGLRRHERAFVALAVLVVAALFVFSFFYA